VNVTVADAKRTYGRTLLLVRPVSGAGEQWVEEGRITWNTDADAASAIQNGM